MVFLNGVFSVMAALSLSYVVLHPRIHEGIGIKAGLIIMILSLGISAAVSFNELPMDAAFKASLWLKIGILMVCVGYAIKYRKAKRCGGPTDFGSLTEIE